MGFGFFFESTVTAPNQAQLLGILQEMTYFYEDTIWDNTMFGPTFNEINIELIRSDFDDTQIATSEDQTTFPVSLNLAFDISFFEGTGDPVPSGDQLVMLLEVADYADFIENYVWNAEPYGELFFDVQVVQFTGLASGV